MSPILLALALVAQAEAPAQDRIREVPIAVYAKHDGADFADLAIEELEIKEDGDKRTVLGVRRDDRPVEVALILDSSQWIGDDYRTLLVPAAMEFRAALPPGSRLAVWTCGGKVSQPVVFGSERETAEATLQKMAIGGSNFALDALVAASADLRAEGGPRRFAVLVTTTSITASKNVINEAYEALAENEVVPIVMLMGGSGIAGGYSLGGEGRSWDAESVLEHMAVGYGGSYELVLSTQAVSKLLDRAATAISNEFLVRFESGLDVLDRPEVKIKRKDLKVLRSGFAWIAR